MAKQRQAPDEIETIGDGPEAAPPVLDENASLKAELEHLRAENARLREEKAKRPEPAKAHVPAGKFLVEYPEQSGLPKWVVETKDGEHPVDAYRRATGMISTPHVPSFNPTNLPPGRHPPLPGMRAPKEAAAESIPQHPKEAGAL